MSTPFVIGAGLKGSVTRMWEKPPITLSNGRVVVRTPAANGSTDAAMADGGQINEVEASEITLAIQTESRQGERA